MRVLVVEDARPLAKAIADGLRAQAIAADVAFDGAAAEERLAVNDYDVVILDRDLPGVHGDEVCRQIVAGGSQSRVLMLTAASTADGERIRHTGGHGLGLAIVQAIARAHGATLTPRTQPEGGLDVEVTFPAKPASPPGHGPM